MRVLFAANQAASVMRGGVLTQALQTKNALENLGVDVALFDAWHEFNPNEFDLVHIFTANMATYHLARAFRVHNLPIVISPVFFTRRSARVARSVNTADKLISRFFRGFWTDYGLIAEMCHWAEALLPNTTDEAHLFEEAFQISPQKITVVPNGVEERFAQARPDLFEREYGIKNFILNVGHIGPERKNVLRLIEALEYINHPAAIIGRIEDTPSGRACLERAKRNPRLLIVDTLPHDSMLLASAYSACDVFVLPSQYETPGISALEAALAGAKIVITPFGGTKDYFGNNAIYVDPTSVEDIVKGIKTALGNEKDPELSERIRKEFIWNKVGEKTKQVYEHVLGLA
jgi:glycosyltransferase involved in cell wall biosynthesis